MLCAKCGARNPDTVLCCSKCGALLEVEPGSFTAFNMPGQPFAGSSWDVVQLPFDQQLTPFQRPAANSPGADVQPWFAPIAHSPFNNEPLPQPSQPLPALIQPTGDILTFIPVAPSFMAPEPTPSTSFVSADPAASSYPDPYLEFASHPTDAQLSVLTTRPILPGPATYVEQQSSTQASVAYPGVTGGSVVPGAQHSLYAGHQPGTVVPPFQALPAAPLPGKLYPGPAGNSSSTVPRGQAHQTPTASEMNKFVRPLPMWAFLLSAVAGALLLAVLVFFNADWATGAMIAGVIAIIMGVLLLIAAGVRVALGMLAEANPRRLSQVISVALCVLLLFLFSGIAMTQQTGLHAMQARYLERQHNWSTAISEYQAAGEMTPVSDSIARVYNEWGEELSKQQQYAGAVAQFSAVQQNYSHASGQISRARTGMLVAYLAWGDYALQHQDYAGATSHYDALLGLNYCDAGCQRLAGPGDATAYYQLAERQFNAQQFALSVNAFNSLVTRFADSPEAKQAHVPYAKALWSLGQQQLNTICSNAVKTYQQLVLQFADTDQGNLAANALKQPVTVKGHFTTAIPGVPYHPTVALVQGMSIGIQQYQFPPLLHNAPITSIGADGTFTFASVPQKTYELVWSNDGILHFYYANDGSQVLYTAHIGPLCTYDYGDINETIPTTGN